MAAARSPVRGYADGTLGLARSNQVVIDTPRVLRPDGRKDLLRRRVYGAQEALVAVVEDIDERREAPCCVLVCLPEPRHLREHDDVEGVADSDIVVGAHIRLAELLVGELGYPDSLQPSAMAGQHTAHRHRDLACHRRLLAPSNLHQRLCQARRGFIAQGPEEAPCGICRSQLLRLCQAEVLACLDLQRVAVPQHSVDEGLEDLAVDARGVQLVRCQVRRRDDRAARGEEPFEECPHDHGVANVQHVTLVEAEQGGRLQEGLSHPRQRICHSS
mmetsp:Transcript_67363/g.196929  ORF Transcript_67363/g.196929 Transcript_67363/m.196929 type:complete len:273 (-) Transcript_67363:456-1274(-)